MGELMENPNNVVEFLLKNAKIYAKAKSERIYIEEFRKSKKALLMQQAQIKGVETMAAQERDAYANTEYQDLLVGLKEAVEVEEKLRWQLIAAQMKIDIWRSQEASNRQIDRATL
jgi:hypothetical protein